MVQVINKTPDIYDTLAGLLGKTGEGFSKGIQASMTDFFEEKKNQRKATRVEDLLKGISDEELDPTHKKLIMSRARGDITSDALTLLMKQNQQGLEHSTKKKKLVEGVPRAIKSLAGDEWEAQSTEDKAKYSKLAGDIFDRTGNPDAAQQGAIDQFLKDQRGEDEDFEGFEGADQAPDEPSPFRKGFDSSIAGHTAALTEGESLSDFKKRTALPKNANIFQRTAFSLGKFAADSPFYFIGGAAGAGAGGAVGAAVSAPTVVGVPFGAMAGSIVGGGAGTFALPTMIETALEEYHSYLDGGGKGSFGDFIESVGNVMQSGVDAGVEGASFGILSRVVPLLKKDAKMRKLFESTGKFGKVSETVTSASIETAGILGSRIAAGKPVSVDDATDLFVNVLGLNVFGKLAPKAKEQVTKIVRKSGIEPQDFAQNVAADLQNRGVDAANPAEFMRSVRDVSKEYSKAKDVFKQAEKPEVRQEKLEERVTGEKELAEKVSKKPVEEFTKDKRSKREKEQHVRLKKTQGDIREAESKINELRTIRQEERPTDKKGLANLKLAEDHAVKRLEGLKETRGTIREEVKAAKPKMQSEAELVEGIQKHMGDLVEMAEKPGGATDQRYQQLFERDQKWIDKAQDLIKTGELPPSGYVDAYTKILQKYDNAYKKMLSETKQALQDLKAPESGEPTAAKKRLQKLEKDLLKNKDINNSKQLRQAQKNFIKDKFRGPGRTFFKKYLKDLKTQSKNLKKNLFEFRKEVSGKEAKITRLGHEAMKQEVKALVEKPTDVNVKRFAEKVGLEVSDTREALDMGKDISAKIADEVKKGSPWERAKEHIGMEKSYFKEKTIPKIKKAILGGILGNVIQGSLEKFFDIKVPLTALTFFLPGFHKVRFGAAIMSNLMRQIYNKSMDSHWKKRMREAGSVSERTAVIRELKRKGWSSAKIAKLRRA